MFAQMMIPHHQQALDMAGLGLGRLTDARLRQLVVQIRAAQDPEIRTMIGWLSTWQRPVQIPSGNAMHGMGPHGPTNMPGMMSDADMARLYGATGAAFDRLFAQMMIAHHEGAIQMARTERTDGANGDAKALAERIITGQQAEIDTMRAILAGT